MFVESHTRDRYLGMNPAFVKRVRAKRKAEAEARRDAPKLEARRKLEADRAARAAMSVEERERVKKERQALQDRKRREARALVTAANEKQHRGAQTRRELDALAALIPVKRPAAEIIAEVAAKYGATVGEVVGASRKCTITAVRFLAIRAVADARPDLSNKQMGIIFGNRDHTSIMNALRQTRAPGQLR